jgi:uncharacterized membrane protein YoaK (UPF0700 family)
MGLPKTAAADAADQPARVMADPQTRSLGADRVGAWWLSLIAGYVDTAGCLALFGLFPSHVTGDLVSIGALTAAYPKPGALARIAMLPLFMAAVAAAAVTARWARRRGGSPMLALLLVMTAGLAVFCAVGVAFESGTHGPDGWPVILVGGAAVSAMGIQNALMREALEGQLPTTVMTGNLTAFTMHLVDLVGTVVSAADPTRDLALARIRTKLVHFGGPLSGFIAGVAAGGFATGRLGLASIAVPALLCAGLAARAFWRSRPSEVSPLSSGVFRRVESPHYRASLAASEHDTERVRMPRKG